MQKEAPKTGPEAIAYALSKLDLDALEKESTEILKQNKISKRPKAIQTLNIIHGLRRNAVAPQDLVIRHVPVVPPVFRPFSVAGNVFIPGDANTLYKDFFNYKDVYNETRKDLGEKEAGQPRLNMYDSIKALYGYGDSPNPKTQQMEVAGFLKQILGPGSPKYCYDKDTEILTETGWVKFPDYDPSIKVVAIDPKTMAGHLETPLNVFVDDYDGPMHRINHRKQTDLLVTPEHRLFIKKRKRASSNFNGINSERMDDGWEFMTAEKYHERSDRTWMQLAMKGFSGNIPRETFGMPPKIFAKFVGFWAAEGSNHRDRCGAILSQMETSDYLKEIDAMMNASGIKFSRRVAKGAKKCVTWYVPGRPLVQWLSDNIGDGSFNKCISREILNWSSEYLEEFLRGFLIGDGCRRTKFIKAKNQKYSTKPCSHEFRWFHAAVSVSIGLLQGLREIGIKCGVPFGSTLYEQVKQLPYHNLFRYNLLTNRFAPSEGRSGKSIEQYKGKIYCVTVSTGLIMVRRNGKSAVCGNSFISRKLLSKPVDNVGRGTVIVDPDLTINQIGIPRNIAWKMYSPYVQRRLVRSGMNPKDALLNLRDQTPLAHKALDTEIKVRPVIYSRAPAWHKYNVVAGHPKLIDGDAIATNPFCAAPMTMDYDGDAINVHVPSSDDAVKEAYDKLMPDKMAFSIRDQDKVVNHIKHEQILPLFAAGQRASTQTHTFKTRSEALHAIKSGLVPLNNEIHITDENNSPPPMQ